METAMFEVVVAARFEAAHRLIGDFGPAARTHGHTYRLEVTVRGEELAEDGTLVDIGELRPAVDEVVAALHYTDLTEVPGLSSVNTTAEHVARYCWEQLAPAVQGRGLSSLRVALWESEDVGAALDAPLERSEAQRVL
jgi:6-pyruvoyltetrahydropterin/6-carboxytetrahydropterin synthase